MFYNFFGSVPSIFIILFSLSNLMARPLLADSHFLDDGVVYYFHFLEYRFICSIILISIFERKYDSPVYFHSFFVFLLNQFESFIYNVTIIISCRLVSIETFNIILGFVYFYFNLNGPNAFFLSALIRY